MRLTIALTVTAMSSALAGPAAADEVLVWQEAGGAYKSYWVSVDGDTVKTLATRDEAVLSDGETLWAMEMGVKTIEILPCEAMEDEDGGHAAEGEFDWPSLRARPLNGGGEPFWVLEPWEGAFFGEVWSKSIELVGSVGSVVMVEHINTGYGCGAHGYDDSGGVTWDVKRNKRAAVGSILEAPDALTRQSRAELAERALGEECAEDEEIARDSIILDNLEIDAGAAGIGGKVVLVHPTGASWAFNCTLEDFEGFHLDDMKASARPSKAALKAIASLKLSGTVGYADLKLEGQARAEALAGFKGQPAPPRAKRTHAKREAKPHIQAGRKATKDKDYDKAISAFTTAIRIDRKAARAWSGRGYAKMLAGKLESAARDFDQALKLDATDKFHAAIWFNLGQVSEKQGKPKQARRAYQKSLKLRPSKAVQGALDKLAK